MASEVILHLDLIDVYGDHLKEKVDILFHHVVLSENLKANANASRQIPIKNLRGFPQGLYRMEVDPPSYQYVGRFVNMKASGITSLEIPFPIDPAKVKRVRFPAYPATTTDLQTLLGRSDKVLSYDGLTGNNLYEALDDVRKAGLLNIAKKASSTALANGKSVLSYLLKLTQLRGDRIFASVPREFREETKNSVHSGLFHEAGEQLHHPPAGYMHAGSFKTPDHYGNLQLTFFRNGDDWLADIDIDDAQGLEHIYQVVHNKLSGKPTHPYNIHEILVHQHLDPGYTFEI